MLITYLKRKNVQIALQKLFFASLKEHLCLTKGHLDNPEVQVEIESEVIFDNFCFY